ncbi:MAG: hypothetical protein WCB44_05040, partial [Stellaceae bacterium]
LPGSRVEQLSRVASRRCRSVTGIPNDKSVDPVPDILTFNLHSPARSRRMEQQDGARVSAAYLRFAEDEVRDKSPL